MPDSKKTRNDLHERKKSLERFSASLGLTFAHCRLLDTLLLKSMPYGTAVVEAYLSARPYVEHCEEFISAIDECLDAALLHYVREEDVEQQRRTCQDEGIIPVDDTLSRAGEVDLTAQGYKVAKKFAEWMRGHSDIGGRYFDIDDKIAEVFAPTRKALDNYLKFLRETRSYQVVKIDAVGPWRLSRFEITRRGVRASLRLNGPLRE